MLQKEIYCCGTVRLNRRGMPEVIKAAKLKKRGETITNCDVPAPVASELYKIECNTPPGEKRKKMVQILNSLMYARVTKPSTVDKNWKRTEDNSTRV